MSNWTIGIDPGYSGALVLMDEGGEIKNHWKMPTVGDKKSKDYDIFAIEEIVRAHERSTFYIEAFASFALSAVTVKSLVRCVTIFEVLVRYSASPLHIVPSQTWQKVAFVGTDAQMKPKARALIAAERIFGAESRKWSEGVRDAALIAWYGSRKT